MGGTARASTARARAAERSGANGASPPAVILMARAPRRGEVRHALESLIGLDACVALQTALIVEATRWARSLEPREL
ncbi:MAG: hypothetical protein ACRDL5_10155, partial [Solirubrobacteraceae bacterium]